MSLESGNVGHAASSNAAEKVSAVREFMDFTKTHSLEESIAEAERAGIAPAATIRALEGAGHSLRAINTAAPHLIPREKPMSPDLQLPDEHEA